MALGKLPFGNKRLGAKELQQRDRTTKRRALVETLESRHLMAGPQLIGIQPNVGELLSLGDASNNVRQTSPRELVFHFDDVQTIRDSTLGGIRITRSGGDGTFGVPTATSDLGSAGRIAGQITGGAEVLLSGADPELPVNVTLNRNVSLAPGTPPSIAVVVGQPARLNQAAVATQVDLTIAPNTTVAQLVSAINGSPALTSVMKAELIGGAPTSLVMLDTSQTSLGPIRLNSARDLVVTPGEAQVGEGLQQNDVTLRFTNELPDDVYRIEVFGFDDPVRGIVGLRNTGGELFVASSSTSRQDTYGMRLDLGPRVEAVVPQPVVRLASGLLEQRRNEVVVYFNDDNLFIEYDANGVPTARSAENPRFYSLILTNESTNNLDDQAISPTKVIYNPQSDTATLLFDSDLANLFGGRAGTDTLRLRIGSAESTPLAPVPVNLGGRIANVTLAGGAGLQLETKQEGRALQVVFQAGANHGIVLVGDVLSVSLAAGATLQNVVSLIEGDATASALVSVTLNGSGAAVVNALPQTANLLEVGGTFDTASTLGVYNVGVSIFSQRLTSQIDPQFNSIELPGGNDDPGHRSLPEAIGGGREQHVNIDFGPDVVSGITTLPYNFRPNYVPGRTNAISEQQRNRIREALDLWGTKLGIQFIETPNQGLTFARGDLNAVPFGANRYLRSDLDFGVLIDPRLADVGFNALNSNALLVMDALRTWNDRYAEDFFRTAMAGIGFLLGLEAAPDLPANTIMALNDEFLKTEAFLLTPEGIASTNLQTVPRYITNVGDQRLEPVFPGNADVLHGRFLFRPDSNDIDLYRFEVKLDDPNKVGELTVETFAERLPTSSLLDTHLTLYRQQQASLETDFGLNRGVALHLEAKAQGLRGNRVSLQFVVTPNGSAGPVVSVNPLDPNAISIFSSNPGQVSFQALSDAINAHPTASQLVTASLVHGGQFDPANLFLTGLAEETLPKVLSGGKVEALARNDDYFSEDSLLKIELSSGIYYIAVTSQGNETLNPVIDNSGDGGKTQGFYDLLVKFRPLVDETDVLRDLDGNGFSSPTTFRVPGSRLDGDADGVAGGIYNFWFQTRPLNRQLVINGGDRFVDGQLLTITDARGIKRQFEFSTDGIPGPNRVAVSFSPSDAPASVAASLVAAINNSGLLISTTLVGNVLSLNGERSVEVSAAVTGVEVIGRTIFVDKDPSAGPQAEGTLTRPFNNIAATGVPNAFDAALPGDLVRIVANAGLDQVAGTLSDNLPYQFGFGSLPGQLLEDGTEMEVPLGVTVMVDAGAVFKLRRSYIGVGSTSNTEDRSESALQVLGTPRLVDNLGRLLTLADGSPVPGSVYFTSALDEVIGRDLSTTSTTPGPGNWGGIQFNRSIDRAEGRPDLEDQGIFIQHVGFADIRYGGGKDVVIDGDPQVVNPISIVDRRPTIVHNSISSSSDAAISASPDSFEETNFQSPRYQTAAAFTADYDRVGPNLYRNQLVNNSINGMFVRSVTPVAGTLRELNVSARFDDIDIVHYFAENLVVSGTPGSATADRSFATVTLVTGRAITGGTLAPGAYQYRVSFFDLFGNESIASAATDSVTTTATRAAIELAGLPRARDPFVGRRLYRTRPDGTFDLVAELDSTDSRFIDRGERRNPPNQGIALSTTATQVVAHRPDASIVMDAGIIAKLEGARIEVEFGAQLLAEGLPGLPIVFTSKLDDRFGIGGSLDTNNDQGGLTPAPGNWGGLYIAPTAHLSLDNVILAYAGGLTRIEGTFKSFNPIELQQGTARITNTVFQDNANGQGGQGPVERFGRLANSPATILSRGVQPILVGNAFLRNAGSAIDIDIGAFSADLLVDVGRQTGSLDRVTGFEDNFGPLVRSNQFEDNDINGMEVRGAEVTTETVLDDTDIVHVFYDEISTGNFHSSSGIRLQSRPDQSLVVKFAGTLERPDGRQVGSGSPYQDRFGTGLTAFGTLSDAPDRIGGTLHIIGFPGSPVVLTSLADDSVGAGTRPDGRPQTDTNNDSFGSRPRSNDWRGILLDQYSSDRNVDYVPELETATITGQGINATTKTAQVVGELAGRDTESDENRRLGFAVQGVLSQPGDVDVYSFMGEAGTEIWFDIDKTTHNLDTIVEFLNVDGEVLARSDDSTAEAGGTPLGVFGLDPEQVGSLKRTADLLTNFNESGQYDEFGTTNLRDAGIRVTLPGTRSARSIYHVRVRSKGIDTNDISSGLTSGSYTLQIRMQEEQEIAGSIVRFADIRYSLHGVHLRGLPYHSPLLGEAQENEQSSYFGDFGGTLLDATNDSLETNILVPGNRAQFVGNLLETDRLAISVGGELSNPTDVDFYQFEIDYANGTGLAFPTIIDLDYADELGRPDMNLSVYYDADGENGAGLPQLVLFSQDSNIADDRSSPLGGALAEDFLRGSVGDGDPFLGTQMLPEGTYYVAITERSRLPSPLSQPATRREPINSVARIVDDQIESIGSGTFDGPQVPQFVPRTGLPQGWSITNAQSANYGHGLLPAFDGSRNSNGSSVYSGAVQPEQDFDQTFFITNNTVQVTTLGGAQNLDLFAPEWSLGLNANIGDAFTNTSTSIPHTSVRGTLGKAGASDVVDLYSVNHAGGQLIIDIDDAAQNSFFFNSGNGLDTSLILLSAFGGIVTIPGFVNPSTNSSTFAGQGGSVSTLDPFIVQNLPAGTYIIGVMPPLTTYNEQAGRFERPATTATAPEAGYTPGEYTLHVSSSGHAVTQNLGGNASLNFTPDAALGGPNVLETAAFSLAGYSAADQPFLYFNYLLDADADDSVTIRVVSDANPFGTIVATNSGFNAALGTFQDFRQTRISLGAFAGQSGLRLQVTYNDSGSVGTQEGLYLDDFIIGFAERGELITGALEGNNAFTSAFGAPVAVSRGTYQFEIRQGTEYGISTNGAVTLTDTFDTNERQLPSVTFIAPEGDQIQDRDFFQIGDGSRSLIFEFDSDGSVEIGRIRIPFTTGDSNSQVAAAIIQAINSPQVQAVLQIKSATPAGDDSGSGIGGGSRINIFGNVTGDFAAQIERRIAVQPGGTALALAQTLAASDVQVSNALVTGAANGSSFGTYSGGLNLLGVDTGVVLANGPVLTALGPNVSDSSTGTATGVGDPAVDGSFGITSSDFTSLEFDVAVPNNASSLFLQLTFASEEYSEDLSIIDNDIAAVYVDGVAVPIGVTSPVGVAGAEVSANVYPATSPLTTLNDPVSGGDFLDRFGYDGFSFVLRAAATGLVGGSHRVRIVIADNGTNTLDSAIFLSAGSLSTVAPLNPRLAADPTGRVVFPALVSNGTGDQNTRRQQGQILIQNNTFTEIAAYGVWTEPGDRAIDPEDARNFGNQFFFPGFTFPGLSATHPYLEVPRLGNSGIGAAQNLRALNDSVIGGLAPGAYIANNIFDNAGAAAVHIAGESRPFQITALAGLVEPEVITVANVNGTHFGDFLPDGLTLTIDAGHTRVVFEFEDIGGKGTGGANVILGCGSGVSGGNGVAEGHVPVYYRKDGGPVYNGRIQTPGSYGYNEMEIMHSIRDSILGSILVTNGIVELVDPVIAPSLVNSSFLSFFGALDTGMGFSHPALYVNGASTATFSTEYTTGGPCDTVPFDLGGFGAAPQVQLHEGVQPFAKVVNNTIYGTDGDLNLTATGTGLSEPSDTLKQAVDTRQGSGHNPASFTTTGFLGDGPLLNSRDVDFYSFSLDVGDRVRIDVDTGRVASPVDTSLRLFNSRGELMLLNDGTGNLVETINAREAPDDTTSLTNAIVVADTVIDVGSTAGFANRGTIQIDNERITYTGITGTSFTGAVRGAGGTTAVTHNQNATVVAFPRIDPSIDYTATEKGIYYVGVSADRNINYDPFSLADRATGGGTGDYALSLEVLAPRTFVLTPDVTVGGSITISQIADVPGQPNNTVTINLNGLAGDRPWDKAAALADRINAIAATQLFNHENNNGPGGGSGPITRVEAAALGGIDGDVADVGIQLQDPETGAQINGAVGGVPDNIYDTTIRFPRTPLPGFDYTDNIVLFRPHAAGGNNSDFTESGFGHTRGSAGINTAGRGTTELHVWVRNAASIDISNATGLRMDPRPTMNADQLLPQTGILSTAGASPTLLNNVIINTHGGVVEEVTRLAGFGDPGEFLFLHRGNDLHRKPGEIIVGGSIFQGINNDIDSYRQVEIRTNTGIFRDAGFELGPSNINAFQDDFNFTLDDSLQLLVNPEGGNFLPGPRSPLIDSSIDSLLERDEFNSFKSAIGVAPSPIFAPSIDVFGQFRSDDPNVASPSGLGGDVFKDRGAADRADFVGPVADLLTPLDNDAVGRDIDPSLTIVELASGVASEFRIRIQDIGDAADPFVGIGVDDSTVAGPARSALRRSGAAVTVFEDGQLLQEGFDYVFSYDSSTNEIILTPVAGIFRPRSIYRIEVNNRDRFVVQAPSGPQAIDGSTLSVTDSGGGRVLLEFETGHQIRLPSDLTLQVPEAGGSIGGVQDGDRITIALPAGNDLVFEFDSNNSLVNTGAVLVSFRAVDTRDQIARVLLQALQTNAVGTGKPLSAARLILDTNNAPTGKILLIPANDFTGQAVSGVTVGVGASTFGLPSAALGISVLPNLSIVEGESFTISDGRITRRFEIDIDSVVTAGSIPVDVNNVVTPDQLALVISQAIMSSGLSAVPTILSGRIVYLGLPENSTLTANGPGLRSVAVSRPVRDGQGFAFGLSSTITGRALLNNVATLRFAGPHHFSVGQSVVVSGIDTVFDGSYIISAVTATANSNTLSYARVNGNIPFAAVTSLAAQATTSVRVEFDSNGQRPLTAIAIPLQSGQSNSELAVLMEQALANNVLLNNYDVNAKSFDTLVSFFGNQGVSLNVDAGAPFVALGSPGVQGGTALIIAGPLLMRVPPVGGVAIPDGSTFTISNNGLTITFEMDVDNTLLNPTAVRVPYLFADSAVLVAASIANAIRSTGLGVAAIAQNTTVSLGSLPASSVLVSPNLPIPVGPGTVSDGQRVTLRNGTLSTTFEFESTIGGGGVILGNTQVPFDPNGSADDVAISLTAAINGSGLGITAVLDPVIRNRIVLVDTPQTRIDVSFAPTVQVTGVPGGAIPVRVVNSSLFTAGNVKNALINAINLENIRRGNGLTATDRGADTFFLEGALALGPELQSFYLRAVQDELGNPLKPNQADNSVRFSILLPDAAFDFGDAPDPVDRTPGRYPTLEAYNGARHVVTLGADRQVVGPKLGLTVDAEPDGQPSVNARGDDLSIQANAALSTSGQSVFTVATSPVGVSIQVVIPATVANLEGATVTVQLGSRSVTFEVDSNGQFDEDNLRVPYDPQATTAAELVQSLRSVIESSSLNLAGLSVSGNVLTLIADDEDGVVFGVVDSPSTVLSPGGKVKGSITTRGPGVLSVWVDTNFDGDWTDPGEQIYTNLAIPSGTSTQPFEFQLSVNAASPVDPLGTVTYARYRIASIGPLEPTGLALDGEVEDHPVRIVGISGGFAANPDTYSLTEDSTLPAVSARNVLSNDNARNASQNQVYSADVGQRVLAGGILTLNANGTFSYAPNANFFGLETFTYRVVDQSLLAQTGDLLVSAPTTVTITVAAVNDAPRRRDDPSGTSGPYSVQFTVAEDSNTTLTASEVLAAFNSNPNDDIVPGPSSVGVVAPFDESDQTLRLVVIGTSTTTQGGTVQILADGSLNYRPLQDFTGSDTFRLRAQDNGAPQQFTELNVSVFVVSANDPPVVNNKTVSTNEDQALVVSVANGLLVGASDPDGNSALLRVTGVDTLGTRGTVQLSGDKGAFTYTPFADINGTDEFRFTVTDQSGATVIRTVTVNVASIADPPRATSTPLGTLNLIEDGSPGFKDLSLSFTDPDRDPLTFTVTSTVPAGRVTTLLNGPQLQVTPLPNQFGQNILVVVSASDGDPQTPDFSQTLTVNITGVNDPPSLVGGGIPDKNIAEDSIIPSTPLSQFLVDPDGDVLQFRVVTNTNPNLVTATINNGNLSLVLVPNASGTGSIIVEASDGSQSITDQFSVNVSPVADAPAAVADALTVPRGGVLDVSNPQQGLLANDSDAEADAFSLVAVRINGQERSLIQAPFILARGVLEVISSSGTFRYVNNSGNLNDTDSFEYVVQDATGQRSIGTVTLQIGNPLLSHHNPLVIGGNAGRDVSGDGKVSPIDALLVINLLNTNTTVASIPVRRLPPPPSYYDVDASGFITSTDAIQVINQLNKTGVVLPGGEPTIGLSNLDSRFGGSMNLAGGNLGPQAMPMVASRVKSTVLASGTVPSGEPSGEMDWVDFAAREPEEADQSAAVDAVFDLF